MHALLLLEQLQLLSSVHRLIAVQSDSSFIATMISGHAYPGAIQASAVIFTVIAGLAIVARLYTRVFLSKQIGLDDAFITVSGVSNYTDISTLLLMI